MQKLDVDTWLIGECFDRIKCPICSYSLSVMFAEEAQQNWRFCPKCGNRLAYDPDGEKYNDARD